MAVNFLGLKQQNFSSLHLTKTNAYALVWFLSIAVLSHPPGGISLIPVQFTALCQSHILSSDILKPEGFSFLLPELQSFRSALLKKAKPHTSHPMQLYLSSSLSLSLLILLGPGVSLTHAYLYNSQRFVKSLCSRYVLLCDILATRISLLKSPTVNLYFWHLSSKAVVSTAVLHSFRKEVWPGISGWKASKA